jgi:hypothetical protein
VCRSGGWAAQRNRHDRRLCFTTAGIIRLPQRERAGSCISKDHISTPKGSALERLGLGARAEPSSERDRLGARIDYQCRSPPLSRGMRWRIRGHSRMAAGMRRYRWWTISRSGAGFGRLLSLMSSGDGRLCLGIGELWPAAPDWSMEAAVGCSQTIHWPGGRSTRPRTSGDRGGCMAEARAPRAAPTAMAMLRTRAAGDGRVALALAKPACASSGAALAVASDAAQSGWCGCPGAARYPEAASPPCVLLGVHPWPRSTVCQRPSIPARRLPSYHGQSRSLARSLHSARERTANPANPQSLVSPRIARSPSTHTTARLGACHQKRRHAVAQPTRY